MTSFDYHIGEKTEAICDRILVVVPRHASIYSGTENMLILEKMMKIQQFRPPSSPNCSRRTR